MMTLDNNNPNPGPLFINHLLDNHPDLHKVHHIDMLAHHIPYKKEEFAKVMPSDTVLVSSLREPVSHFKSIVNYYKVWGLGNTYTSIRNGYKMASVCDE